MNAAGNEEVRSLYRLAFDRWEKSLTERNALQQVLQTQGRVIVGLGSENVLKTGIRLHHNYGLPILPGSALKGLAAHYCHVMWGETERGEEAAITSKRFRRGWEEEKHEYHRLLFGKTDDSGCIAFHDGWFVPQSSPQPLVLDVMTPHHPQWNDIKNPVAPTDFDSPIPVPFLATAGKFLLAVSWHGPESEQSTKWTQFALSTLTQVLAEWGIGGKTSSGYGRLVPIELSDAPGTLQSRAAPAKPKEPVHRAPKKVRVIQRTVHGKLRYEADDGFLGSLLKGTPPDLNDGESTELWIVRVDKQNKKVPYVLQTDEPQEPKSPSREKGRRDDRQRPGGRQR